MTFSPGFADQMATVPTSFPDTLFLRLGRSSDHLFCRWDPVIGVHDPITTEMPVGCVLLKTGRERDPAGLERELVKMAAGAPPSG